MILEALFNGEIYASEDIVPKSDRFRQTAAHISETMTYFPCAGFASYPFVDLPPMNDCKQSFTVSKFYTFPL